MSETSLPTRRTHLPRHLRLFAVLLATALLVWCGLKVKAALYPYNEVQFNSVAWRSARTMDQKIVRSRMAGDLVQSHLRNGMTKAEVISLIGPPDELPNLAGFARSDMPEMREVHQYDMGRAWLDMAGQHFLLRLYFDASGRLLLSETVVD